MRPRRCRSASRPPSWASAYTNDLPSAAATTRYDLDALQDTLVVQSPPNDGLLKTIGKLGAGIDVAQGASFDIATTMVNGIPVNRAYVLNADQVYSIDLKTGAATLLGDFGGAGSYVGFTDRFVPLAPPAGRRGSRHQRRLADRSLEASRPRATRRQSPGIVAFGGTIAGETGLP